MWPDIERRTFNANGTNFTSDHREAKNKKYIDTKYCIPQFIAVQGMSQCFFMALY